MPNLSQQIDALLAQHGVTGQTQIELGSDLLAMFRPYVAAVAEVKKATAGAPIGSTAYNVHMYLHDAVPKEVVNG